MNSMRLGFSMLVAVVFCGCTSTLIEKPCDDSPLAAGFRTRVNCPQIQISSVLGIDDQVLSDTNRFAMGTTSYSHEFKLDTPFLGFTNVRVYLDEMGGLRGRSARAKPHQLRSVEFRKYFNTADSDELLKETQKICDQVCELLDVETPEVQLADLDAWRKVQGKFMFGGVKSHVYFQLAKGQGVQLRLTEASFTVRKGKAIMTGYPSVELDVTYNPKLNEIHHPCHHDSDDVAVEKQVAMGPDCSAKLTSAIKCDIARNQQVRARRRNEAKSKTNKGETVSPPVLTPDSRK